MRATAASAKSSTGQTLPDAALVLQPDLVVFIAGGIGAGSGGSGAVLVAAAPGGPAQPVGGRALGAADEGGQEPGGLVAGQRDLAAGRWLVGVLGGGGNGQERGGEHGQGDPAVPGAPPADLVLVQPASPYRPGSPPPPSSAGPRPGSGR
jgi:hypothetical protein